MADYIYIRELAVSCIVGINPRERIIPQTVLIDIRLTCDLARAAAGDDIADTVDYKTLKDELLAVLEPSAFFLIERMAEVVAERCLSRAGVAGVRVTVDKPGALTGARSVAVEIERGRA
jgi:D-erythro-7,8-dihydroneopterin triphosphate epimerase